IIQLANLDNMAIRKYGETICLAFAGGALLVLSSGKNLEHCFEWAQAGAFWRLRAGVLANLAIAYGTTLAMLAALSIYCAGRGESLGARGWRIIREGGE